MSALKAHVENGRVVLDEPMDLPEGTALHVVAVSNGDDLDEVERAELHAELVASLKEANAGQLVDFEDVLTELRARP